MEKIPLILFSGGLDSSFLLSERLKEGNCDVLYVNGPQGQVKADAELEARDKIIDYLHLGRKGRVERRPLYDGQSINMVPVEHVAGQILAWFFAAMLEYDHRRHSKVEMAYISGDSANYDLPGVKQAWDILATTIKKQAIPLEFPLIYVTKQSIMERIDPELYSMVWVCETPVNYKVEWRDKLAAKACGECIPCLRRAAEEFVWEKVNKGPYPSGSVVARKEPSTTTINYSGGLIATVPVVLALKIQEALKWMAMSSVEDHYNKFVTAVVDKMNNCGGNYDRLQADLLHDVVHSDDIVQVMSSIWPYMGYAEVKDDPRPDDNYVHPHVI